jgi:hypothetical protein
MVTRYVVLLSALLISGEAYGQSVCFLDHLEKHGNGVIAHFEKDRWVTLIPISGEKVVYYTSDEPKPYIEKGTLFAMAIPASVGDKFAMIINPHAACSLTIAIQGGQIGVLAEGPNEPPPPGLHIPFVQSDWVKFFPVQ